MVRWHEAPSLRAVCGPLCSMLGRLWCKRHLVDSAWFEKVLRSNGQIRVNKRMQVVASSLCLAFGYCGPAAGPQQQPRWSEQSGRSDPRCTGLARLRMHSRSFRAKMGLLTWYRGLSFPPAFRIRGEWGLQSCCRSAGVVLQPLGEGQIFAVGDAASVEAV